MWENNNFYIFKLFTIEMAIFNALQQEKGLGPLGI